MKRAILFSGWFLSLLLIPALAWSEFKIKPLFVEYQDEKENSLKFPEGVACGAKGFVVVADTGNARLVKYQFQNGEPGTGAEMRLPQILYPIRVAITQKNEILVLDGRLKKIARVSQAGAFIGYLEPKGIPGVSTYFPKSVAVDGNSQIYILDIANSRILVLDAVGNFTRELPFPADFGFISDIAVDSRGTVFALDSVGFKVYKSSIEIEKFTTISSNLKEYLDFPSNIAVDQGGKLYIADQNGSGLVLLGPDGSFQGRQLALGWKAGALYYPAQLCVSDTNLIVADRNNNRMQIFQLAR
jgi:sugar lactone lactonase YvrE